MTFVGLLILTRIGERTFVDFAFLSAHQKRESIEPTEVEAQSARQPNE
jgi:hypothetical protein